jgi:hypothetical protein
MHEGMQSLRQAIQPHATDAVRMQSSLCHEKGQVGQKARARKHQAAQREN